MKIPKLLSSHQKDAFLTLLFEQLQHSSFGSTGKRDMDCLMLYCLLESGILQYSTNRELANKLGINETKLKSYLIDIRYKFGEDNIDDNVQKIVAMILEHTQVKVGHDSGYYIFALENPVYRADLEKKMKDLGYYADTSFNKEIVKIRDYAFIAFLFRFHEFDDTYKKFKAIQARSSETEKELLSIIEGEKGWLDKGKDLLKKADEGMGYIQILLKIIRLVSTGGF